MAGRIVHTGDIAGNAATFYGYPTFNGPVSIGGQDGGNTNVQPRDELLNWVKPINTDEILRTALKTRQPGTCQWVLNCDALIAWLECPSEQPALLWLHDPPGFGKTILSASITEFLMQRNETFVQSFFCTDQDATTRDQYAILRSWIGRTLQASDEAVKIANAEFDRLKRIGDTSSNYALWELFKAMGRAIPGLIFIVDGLDECEMAAHAIKYHSDDTTSPFLIDLMEALRQTRIRVLVVSRKTAIIDASFRIGTQDCSDVWFFEHAVTAADNRGDISQCSRTMINKTTSSNFSNETKHQLASEVIWRCDGMFLWLYMLGKGFKSWHSEKALHRTMDKTPATIDEIYHTELKRLLDRRQPDNLRQRAVSIFRWVAHAFRPLTIREISEALTLTCDSETPVLSSEDLPVCWDEVNAIDQYINSIILEACGTLVEIRSVNPEASPASRTLHFPHYSVKEYLLGSMGAAILGTELSPRFDPALDHEWLAEMCLQYLCWVPSDRDESYGEIYARISADSFLAYTCKYWYMHATMNGPVSSKHFARLKILLDHARPSWRIFSRTLHPPTTRWSEVVPDEVPDNHSEDEDPVDDKNDDDAADSSHKDNIPNDIKKTQPNQLYYAASFGLQYIAQYLLKEGFDCNTVVGHFGSAFNVAIAREHMQMVKLLILHGGDVNRHITQPEITDAAASVEPYVSWIRGATPLHLAAHFEGTEILTLLLENGADVNATDEEGYEPSFWALGRRGGPKIDVLIEHGAHVNAVIRDGSTVLMVAIARDDREAVESLIEHGADVNAQRSDGSTVLWSAVSGGNLELVRLLVEHGADPNPNPRYSDELTLLGSAVSHGNLEMVKLLVELGADINTQDSDGWTVLWDVFFGNNLETAKFLIEHGVDINTQTSDGRTIMMMVITYGSPEVVEYLVNHAANVDAIDMTGATAMHHTEWEGDTHTLQLLLDAGADPRVVNINGYAPIHLAASKGLSAIASIGLLLANNALSADFPSPTSISAQVLECFLGRWTGDMLYTQNGLEQGRVEAHSFHVERGLQPSINSEITLFDGYGWNETEEFQIRGQILSHTEVVFLELHAGYGWMWHGTLSPDKLFMTGNVSSNPHDRKGTFTLRKVNVIDDESSTDTTSGMGKLGNSDVGPLLRRPKRRKR